MELHSSNAIHNATLKLIRLLDPFDEPAHVRARMWRVGSLIKMCGKLAVKAYQRAFLVDQWFLLFDLSDDMSTSFDSFKAIVPPIDRLWADPHVVEAEGRYYIFIEEYLHKLGKGHISVIEMDSHGHHTDPVPVLEKDYHLSYPHVFDWQGHYYMVPESAATGTIELYECVEFPHRWERKMTLMDDVRAVDTTLFHHNGKWWLFTAIADDATALPRAKAHLFFSDDFPTDKWTPHPLNPIVTNTRQGRPAGRMLTMGGKLLRPSQDCSKHYGYGFDLNEISLLSETEYVERNVLAVRLDRDRRARATHTLAREGRLTMIDAFTRRFRL